MNEEMMNPAELIEIKQLPLITEQLHDIKDKLEAIADECEGLECTAETIQTVKKRQAEVNRIFSALEDRRKAIKRDVMAPYAAMEKVYEECVDSPYKRAINATKSKISAVEDALKSECETRMRKYFAEIREREHVGDWLSWEMGGFRIGLTEAKKKVPAQLMGQIADFVVRVSGDVKSIDTMENAAAVMDEYKRCLNLALAIQTVTARKERLAAEQEAARIRAETARREQETVARVEQVTALKPPTEAAKTPEKDPNDVFPQFSFTVYGATRAQLWGIRDYLDAHGIAYQ